MMIDIELGLTELLRHLCHSFSATPSAPPPTSITTTPHPEPKNNILTTPKTTKTRHFQTLLLFYSHWHDYCSRQLLLFFNPGKTY